MLKIHIDTDIGGDIDDLCALAMALKWEGTDLVGVTTVAEHVGTNQLGGKRAGMVRYVLGLVGRGDIPVAAGAEATLDCYRTWQGLPDEAAYWPEPIVPSVGAGLDDISVPTSQPANLARDPGNAGEEDPPRQALDLLSQSIQQGAVIVAIGPYTNLALLERRSPGILQEAHLVLMGGYVYPPRPSYPAWGPEMDWNVQVDVTSALTVFEHAAHPTLVPLAVTVETALRRLYLPRLRQSGPLGQLIARQAEAFAVEYQNEEKYGKTCPALPADIINFQHDPLACAIALGWKAGVEVRELTLKSEIRDGWMRQTIDPAGKPARLVTAVDGPRFSQFWLDTVAGK